MLESLNLTKCNPISEPFHKREVEEMEKLDVKESKLYRSVIATGNYISADRPDIQYAVKECSKSMANPNSDRRVGLKKLTKYLARKWRVKQMFRWERS